MEVECPNCDGKRCMACVLREFHDACEDDCPECCGTPLFDLEYETTPEGNMYG